MTLAVTRPRPTGMRLKKRTSRKALNKVSTSFGSLRTAT
jgi:hypothetical protein